MNIRGKLFLSFALYVFFAAMFGAFAFWELNTIKKKLTFLEVADDVTVAMLEARRYEKNYLLYKNMSDLLELRKHVNTLKTEIESIRVEIIHELGKPKFEKMGRAIAEYEGLVENTVSDFHAQSIIQEALRDEGRAIEKRLSGRELEKFLVLRRHEKNLIIYRDEINHAIFRHTFVSLSPATRDMAQAYGVMCEELFRFFQEENETVDKMRATAREMQSLTVDVSRNERNRIAETLTVSMRLLVYALLTILLLGAAINARLAMSIAWPIRRLEKISKQIATGDFSEMIEVKGKDEISSLEAAFNHMEERLKNALTSLEFTIIKLQEKQAQLVAAEKHASVGILAAGVAHEINNPLTSVLTFSNLLLEQVPPDDPRRDTLRLMARETERARRIVRQLMTLAKESTLALKPKNINQPIKDITESLAAQGEFDSIELKLNLADGLPDVLSDCAQMGQVVMNIVLNAVQSITPPGTIEITTRAADGFVEIEFADNGCGIAPENLPRVFDSFFTTKTKGTGLGLAVSYGIIKKHGGDITVQSEAGKGTRFMMRLPIHNG